MATHGEETWIKGTYNVLPLHSTLELLTWDFGALDSDQEKDYIRAKIKMLDQQLANINVVILTNLIAESQNLMREFAMQQLCSQPIPPPDAEVSRLSGYRFILVSLKFLFSLLFHLITILFSPFSSSSLLPSSMASSFTQVCSQSCVSQRDIQRVFTFYQWLLNLYERYHQHGDHEDYHCRAVLVALGIVYFMRLNHQYREKYRNVLDTRSSELGELEFTQAFQEELDWLTSKMELPSGIAKTQILKENMFAIVVCTVTHTPLILVGAPGSSKTLSFNLAIANLKGLESKIELFQDMTLFRSLDPHCYQCSRRTTSNEIMTVFQRAMKRQRTYAQYSLPIYCVVFMDEAGLPEESHESLKVLHYLLDEHEVSFVAISNHVLDASKTNRAVSLFCPAVSDQDLQTLAKNCLGSTATTTQLEIQSDLDTIARLCPAYQELMGKRKFSKFFGLRDFIHFVKYLQRRRTQMLTPQLVIEALERNFNGVYWENNEGGDPFIWLCELFLSKVRTLLCLL